MTIFEYLNIPTHQPLYFSYEYIYVYGDILLNYDSGELITLNKKESLGKQLKVKEYPFEIKDKKGNQIYKEWLDGEWQKREYDANGKETRFEDSDGNWRKCEYDTNGNRTRCEDASGYWWEKEYDANGKVTRYENSGGVSY
jgi:YD repeat-containing protein